MKIIIQQGGYQIKLVLKWNKTDEASAYPAEGIFSEGTSHKPFVFSKYSNIKKRKWPAYFSLN